MRKLSVIGLAILILVAGCGREIQTPVADTDDCVNRLIDTSGQVIQTLGQVLKLASQAMKNPSKAEAINVQLDELYPTFQSDNALYNQTVKECSAP